MAETNIIEELEQIIKHRQKYQVRKSKNKRDIDTGNTTLSDVADVLGTLIDDLRKQGILK